MSRRWLTRTLIAAIVLSLLAHFFTIFGEPLWGFITGQMTDDPAVTKTEKKLAEQEIEIDAVSPDKLPIKPLIDKLTVTLAPAHAVRRQAAPIVKPKVKPKAVASKAAPKAVEPKPENKDAAPSLATDAPATGESTPATAPDAAAVADASPSTTEAPPAELANVSKAFPRDIRIRYLLANVLEGGMTWLQEDDRYTIELKGAGLGRYRLMRAKGQMTKAGLKPEEFVEYHDSSHEQPKYQVRFDWANEQVTFGEPSAPKTEKLNPAALDILSLFFQAAIRGNKLITSDVQIITGRKIYHQQFHVEGESQIHVSGGGDITALLVKGENERGRAALWLAPEWYNLPVRANVELSNGISLSLDASLVEVNGKVLLSRPEPSVKPGPKRDR